MIRVLIVAIAVVALMSTAPALASSKIVEVDLTAFPTAGKLPFSTTFKAVIINKVQYERTVNGSVSITLANGKTFHNIHPGKVRIKPNGSYQLGWTQLFPAKKPYVGKNEVKFHAVDVSPMAKPPIPPPGDRDMKSVTIIGLGH